MVADPAGLSRTRNVESGVRTPGEEECFRGLAGDNKRTENGNFIYRNNPYL